MGDLDRLKKIVSLIIDHGISRYGGIYIESSETYAVGAELGMSVIGMCEFIQNNPDSFSLFSIKCNKIHESSKSGFSVYYKDGIVYFYG